jgi:serine/threonine-protein kinase RIO1
MAGRAVDISAMNQIELLALHAAVLQKLKDLGAVRSINNPISDLAEAIVAKALNGKLATKSSSHYDVIVDGVEGIRTYQVKARRLTQRNSSRQLGALRRMEEKNFDYLVGVLFDEQFRAVKAAIIPWETVKANAKFQA